METDLPAGWVDVGEAAASKEQGVARTLYRGDKGRRIAGLVIRGGPQDLAGLTIEGNQPCMICSSNVEQHTISIDQRRTGGPKKSFADAEPLMGIYIPSFLASGQVQAV